MLQCLSLKSSSATTSSLPTSPYPPPLSPQANSTDGTPRSSTQVSPTVILTREYTLALQTNSYKEMVSIVTNEEVLDQKVLNPNKECVEEAIRHAKPNTLTHLASKYFDNSENTTNLCLSLHQSIKHAREIYGPINELLEILPHDSHTLTQPECDWVFDVFLKFDSLDNPFPCPGSQNFDEMRLCFSQLKEQLDNRLEKSKSRVQLCQRGKNCSALCLIGTAVVVVLSAAAAIATHALVAIVAAPFCTVCFPRGFTKKEVAHMRQLEAASRGTYVLNNDLDTIDRLVASLHTAIEGDKLLIQMGLERGRDVYPIQEVVKQLRKNHVNFKSRLDDLEEHIFLCFNTVNRARSLLLQEIHLQSSSNS